MRTPSGTEYRTRNYSVVEAKVYERWLQVGTIAKVGSRDWAFTAFGKFFESSRAYSGSRATWLQASEAVIRSAEAGLRHFS